MASSTDCLEGTTPTVEARRVRCGNCGLALTRPCPACAFSNPLDHPYCGGCGSSLGSSGEVVQDLAERRQMSVMFCDLVGS